VLPFRIRKELFKKTDELVRMMGKEPRRKQCGFWEIAGRNYIRDKVAGKRFQKEKGKVYKVRQEGFVNVLSLRPVKGSTQNEVDRALLGGFTEVCYSKATWAVKLPTA